MSTTIVDQAAGFGQRRERAPAWVALRAHWPEYLMEAAGLGIFMVSACAFGILLEHPASPVQRAIPDPFVRRALMGVAMGATAIAIIYSPWGKQSGAHINPAVTLAFLRLGRVQPWDATFYMLFQFAGGLAGVFLVHAIAGAALANAAVNHVATVPGSSGTGVAFVTEVAISLVLMLVVLAVSNSARAARATGLFAGLVVASNITFTAPFSGMSMNPARTLASAVPAGVWTGLWIYFTAPPIGMLLAAEVYRWLRGRRRVFCAKLHHDNDRRCIFCASRPVSGDGDGP